MQEAIRGNLDAGEEAVLCLPQTNVKNMRSLQMRVLLLKGVPDQRLVGAQAALWSH